jgi:predicted homoserine dehydrogenase-like protein
MATSVQRSYIKDLAVQRLKEFKEFKEMLYANGIVSQDAETVANAESIDAILDATTDYQASQMIDALIARKPPVRSRAYSQKRAEKTIELLDKIKATARGWKFE